MQTIPDASEKEVTLRNQTHALKKRMPCASSFVLSLLYYKTGKCSLLLLRTARHQKVIMASCYILFCNRTVSAASHCEI